MSATLSEATGRPYGIQRVCQAWERSRSALYARQTREQQRHKGEEPARRGPTPTVSDATLLEAIQADLDRSPFQGEGHRKVHARLRILDGIRVARTRVLRVMRAHKLLSPHRGRQGTARVHAGTIVTQAPNVMWGTDGVRVFTLDDGWGWIFTAVEHWNAECVGWHVCKVGSRFAALEPIAQGLRRIYGALAADSARGLALRMDHGSQYLSDHFLNQIRYWGIRPSYGFVEEPETNGVAERWNRTLKEQATHGRIFQNLKEVRAAVTAFVERYNTTWRLEKLGYHTPIEAREAHELRRARSVNLCPKNWVRYTGCIDGRNDTVISLRALRAVSKPSPRGRVSRPAHSLCDESSMLGPCLTGNPCPSTVEGSRDTSSTSLARLRGPRRGVQPHGSAGSRAVSRRRVAGGTAGARPSDKGVHGGRPAGHRAHHRAHPGVGVPLSDPARSGTSRTCLLAVSPCTRSDAASPGHGAGPRLGPGKDAATGPAGDLWDPVVPRVLGLSRVRGIAGRPSTTTRHTRLGIADQAHARLSCAGPPISNRDDTAPTHSQQTRRAVHQASRGQERE